MAAAAQASGNTTKIIDLKIKGAEALGTIDKLTKELEAQKKIIEGLNASVKQGNELSKEERDEKQLAIATSKQLQKEINEQTSALKNNVAQSRAVDGSLKDLRAQYNSLKTTYEGLNKEQRDKMIPQMRQIKDEIEKADKAVGNYSTSIGNYPEAISALPGPIGKASTAISGMTKAAMAFIATPLGLVVAAISLAIGALTAYFKGSEEGQDRLTKITTIFSSVLNNLGDIVQKVGKYIFEAFTNPKKALEDFGNAIKTNIVNRAEGMLELFPALGKAIALVFKGQFKEAGTVAANALGKVTLGVDDVIGKIGKAGDAIKEFGKQVEADARLAAKVADMRDKADDKERALIVSRAKAEAQIAELRLKAREDDKFTAEQRLAFIKEAGALTDNLAVKEREIAALRYEAIRVENTLSNTTEEALRAEAEAKAALFEADTRRDQAKKGMLRDLDRIKNEIAKTETDREKEKQAELSKIAAEAKAEADKLSKEIEAQRIKDEATEVERKKTALAIELDAEYQLSRSSYDNIFELERFEAQRRYDADKAAAEKVGADTTAITELYEKTKTDIKRRETDNALRLASGFAGNIATIFGKTTKVGKLAATAQIAIDTYRGAIAAYSSLSGIPVVGVPLGIAAAAAAGVTGAKAIKDVWAVKSGLPEGGDSAGTRSINVTTPSAASSVQPASPNYTTTTLNLGSADTGNVSTQSNQADAMKAAIREAYSEIPAPIVRVSDIQSVTDSMQNSKNIAVI
jgi:hypothetical protein